MPSTTAGWTLARTGVAEHKNSGRQAGGAGAKRFKRLPEGIYLDGIVRAYARTVGLDDEAMVQRVRRDVPLRAFETVEESAPEPTVPATGVVYPIENSGYKDLDSFQPEADVAYDRAPHRPDVAHDRGPVSPDPASDRAPVSRDITADRVPVRRNLASDRVAVVASDRIPVDVDAAHGRDPVILAPACDFDVDLGDVMPSLPPRRSRIPFVLAVVALLGASVAGGILVRIAAAICDCTGRRRG